ncbi:S66 family peptidase [Lachnospira multipara]|uniref:S66 family peptidase n=1 Tax=Lachnospira multipara TaxID=28051 RepID=UPI0004826FD9|nr:S66 peptidase family protein [Lachnospira multipara]
MRYPEFLKDKGTIGFVAPSFGCATEPYKTAFDMALERFKSMGYSLDIGPNAYKGEGIGISSTPINCAKELNEMYISDSNDCLISCGGGELMCEILDYVDFEAIKNAKAKFYLGYSDNTNFTFLENILCDTASIYGVCVGAFANPNWHQSLIDTWECLTGKGFKRDVDGTLFKKVSGYDKFELESLKTSDNPAPDYNLTHTKELSLYIGDKDIKAEDKNSKLAFEGRLIGGCLDCLSNLCGTRFDKVSDFILKYKDEGIVWFLESCDLNVFDIRRVLWKLKEAGWFKYTKGFIIGRPMHYDEPIMNLNRFNAVTGILGELNVPIVMDADFGHLSPSMPIISGSYAKVNAENNNIDIFYYLR